MPKEYVRLTTPLVRDGDRRSGAPLRPATWDEALERAVARTAGSRSSAHGPTDVRDLQLLARRPTRSTSPPRSSPGSVLGSNNIDSCNRT